MRIGIMQPYLFPYLGYFQLIAAVDTYVVLDDVQYIKGGWINRNRILLNGQPKLFTFSVKHSSYNLNINERTFTDFWEKDKKKFLNLVSQSYVKAPNFKQVLSILKEILEFSDNNVANFTTNSIKLLCKHMKIKTPIITSSKMKRDTTLKREYMVQDIVKRQEGNEYINAIGGKELYSKEQFENNKIKLYFIKMNELNYSQFGSIFIPNLSIIDVLMFNDVTRIIKMLKAYTLV